MSNSSLLKQLYEVSTGNTVTSISGTRLQESTHTLLGNGKEAEGGLPPVADLVEISLEKREYELIVNRVERITPVRKPGIMRGQTIRIRETDNLRPTGRTMLKNVESIIVGTDSNGIKPGWNVVLWE